MNFKRYLLVLIIISAVFSLEAQDQTASNLKIIITGIRSIDGKLSVSLFNQEAGFPSDSTKIVLFRTITVTDNQAEIIFENIPLGNWAIAALHDSNANGKADTGIFGIPTEGFGVSGSGKSKLGPPKFKDCVVQISSPSTVIQIEMIYLFK